MAWGIGRFGAIEFARFSAAPGLFLQQNAPNYLTHSSVNAINAMLAAAGYNLRRLFRRLELLLRQILIVLTAQSQRKIA
jgi:hypothetical protein